MKLIVNPHKIELIQEQAVNEKEIDISKCTFEFSEEITNEYVKEAYFTLGDDTYKKIIVNNECTFPQEVLVRPATIELGVVAYLVENENEIKRYNPTPVYFKTDLGSLKEAENSQEITPSEMEQYEQALQEGLSEVNSKLEDIDEAITQTNNLDIDANKVDKKTTITITKKDGSEKTVDVLDGADGKDGVDGRDGTDGVDGITPTIGENGNWYYNEEDTGKPSRGETGATGEQGQQGPAGQDGFSPSASVTKSGSTATISITDKNGTTTATVNDGQDGVGIPSGGTTGQVLSKTDGTDYNTEWKDVPTPDLSNYYTKTEADAKFLDDTKTIFVEISDWWYPNQIKDNTGASQVYTFNSIAISKIQTELQNAYDNGKKYINIVVMTPNSSSGNVLIFEKSNFNGTTTLQSKPIEIMYDDVMYNNSFLKSYVLQVSLTWNNDTLTVTSIYLRNIGPTNYLNKANTIAYTPTSDYHPATKKYVDDSIASAITDALGGSY